MVQNIYSSPSIGEISGLKTERRALPPQTINTTSFKTFFATLPQFFLLEVYLDIRTTNEKEMHFIYVLEAHHHIQNCASH
jgi:hypothetical protein